MDKIWLIIDGGPTVPKVIIFSLVSKLVLIIASLETGYIMRMAVWRPL